MALNTLVLGFEVAIAILFLLLCFQLAKHYKSFVTKKSVVSGSSANNKQAGKPNRSPVSNFLQGQGVSTVANGSRATNLSLKIELPSSFEQPKPVQRVASTVSIASNSPSANSDWSETEPGQQKTILNDYIDGFFSDSSSVSAEQLASFKAETVSVPSSHEEGVSGSEQQDLDILESEVASEQVPVLQPILLDGSQLEDEDDSFILVEDGASEVTPEGAETADVMSDKVVLAMLKEAKTACS